ncbi:unnamed protein product [Amaranthus hypochondriacus]
MAESVVYIASEHIASLIDDGSIKADLFGVGSAAMAVQSELKNSSKIMAKTQQNQMVDNQQICSLFTKIRKLAYEAEDLVDTYVYRTDQSSNHITNGFTKIRKIHHTSKKLQKLHKELRKANKKLLLEGRWNQDQGVRVGAERYSMSVSTHLHKSEVEFVVGIKLDVQRLVTKLTITEHSDHVLAIVGRGGSGKTTIARTIYNHPKTKKHFNYRAWVSFTSGWTTFNILSEILRQTSNKKTGSIGSFSDEFFLDNNKCLIVFDNVLDINSFQHKLLHELIHENVLDLFEEIRIMITSRNCDQEHYLNTSLKWCFHEVQPLNQEDATDLLFKTVFGCNRDNNTLYTLSDEYRHKATDILKKCGGLPLAISAIGKILKTKLTMEEWNRVVSELENKEHPNPVVEDILGLSYLDVGYNLKPCLLYFGLFQENIPIKIETMIRMWIAEGFVPRQNGDDLNNGCNLEDEARWMLHKLIESTMVQVVKRTFRGDVKTLLVCDEMRNLCMKEGQKMEFLYVSSFDQMLNGDNNEMIRLNPRRAAINLSKGSTLPLNNPRLRSLVLFGDEGIGKRRVDNKKPLQNLNFSLVFERFRFLRVLDIKGIKTFNGVMPKKIGNLIHLRYLRIISTNITQLPKSIGKLRKLLTLDYRNVFKDDNEFIRLPNILWKFKHLRHLYLPFEMSNKSIKENFKIGTMKDLQTLWGLRGGKWMLKQMPNLSSNLKKMCIQGISSTEQIDSVFNSPVIKLHNNLYSLALEWCGFYVKGSKFEALCSSRSLKKLKLKGHILEPSNSFKLPSNLSKLELCLTRLKLHESMADLGKLQCLKFLKLDEASFVGTEWVVGEHGFPQLEKLKLCNLQNLEKLEMENGAIPCLRKLSIVSCTCLKQLPQGLKSISTLENVHIEHMPNNVNNRHRDLSNQGGDHNLIVI